MRHVSSELFVAVHCLLLSWRPVWTASSSGSSRAASSSRPGCRHASCARWRHNTIHLLLRNLEVLLLLLLYSHLLLDLLLLHRELLLLLLLLDECLVFHHLLLAVASVLAGVALRRLVTVSLFIGLLDSTELLLPLLEVDTLDFLDLRVDALYFKLVGVNLCLVVLQLSNQVFELLATILKILLVLDQLLCHVGTALLSQNVLQLDVELLFLLDQHIFLRDLLGLCDEALLETLDLLDELVGLNARGLKLAPSVHVQRLLELVLQILSLLLLLKQLLLKQVDLTFQVRDALSLFLGVNKLALVLLDLILLLPDVHDLLLIVDLALLQRRLLDLDLLVQEVAAGSDQE